MTPQAAFLTFKNPFAVYLAKKMKKIVKINNIEDKLMIFEREVKPKRIGYLSDMLFFNYGISK